MGSDELCFKCHSYDVYANRQSSELVRRASRFNAPGSAAGHAEHAMAQEPSQSVSCYSCHATHGSVDQPHLMATGRMPGILSFNRTASGGTCVSSCHDPRSYTVNYAR
jgi:hypothetical protein